jgi:hypothetical protein
VLALKDRFPPDTKDVDWILELKAEGGWAVISQDRFSKGDAECSGLMKPDTLLGENARQIEVSDDQTTPYLFR